MRGRWQASQHHGHAAAAGPSTSVGQQHRARTQRRIERRRPPPTQQRARARSTSARAARAASSQPTPLNHQQRAVARWQMPVSSRAGGQPRLRASTCDAATKPVALKHPCRHDQPSVARQGPERKVGAVAVVLQVEHPRKAGRGIARVLHRPSACCARSRTEHRGAPHVDASAPAADQPQQRPGGLIGVLPGAAPARCRGSCRWSRPSRRRPADDSSHASARRTAGSSAPCLRARARPAPTRCRKCSWCPSGRTRSRPAPARAQVGDRARERRARPAARPTRASAVTTRPVTSSVGGSSSAPWSANGMSLR